MNILESLDWFNREATQVASSFGMSYDPNPLHSPLVQNLVQPTQSTPSTAPQPTSSVYYVNAGGGSSSAGNTALIVGGLGLAWLLLRK